MKCKLFRMEEKVQFSSLMMKIGDMMIVQDPDFISADGHILFRASGILISLKNPSLIWSTDTEILGEKLKFGDSVSLIQE